MHHNFGGQQGYIALITSIIISALLLILISCASLSSFYSAENILAKTQKQESSDLAFSCLNMALLRLASDSSWLGAETWKVADKLCHITQVSLSNNNFVFILQVRVNNSFTTLKANVQKSNLEINSIEEL